MKNLIALVAVIAVVGSACGRTAGTASTASPRAAASAASASIDALAAIRARGVLTASIGMEGPPGGRTAQDPAHGIKHSFEAALAGVLAERIVGPNARAQLVSTGRDRFAPLQGGQADLAMALLTPEAPATAFSSPFAAGRVVLVVLDRSELRSPRDLAGKIVASTPGDVDTRWTRSARGSSPR